ncbi:MAG: hypothetical protein QXH80_02820 [Candidatus Nanoarchaeia archaeon]
MDPNLRKVEGALVKSKSPIINAYSAMQKAERAIIDAIKKERELGKSFAAGKIILIKQIIDKEVELYNLLKQNERDMQRIAEYEANIKKLESGLRATKNRVIIRQIEDEMLTETDNAKILNEALEKRATTAKQLIAQIEELEEEVLEDLPKPMYDIAKKILSESKYTEKELLELFKDIVVEAKDLQELDKFIEAEKKKTA